MASTRTKEETAETEAGVSPVPGKPVSQVEAEAPPDAETAAAWAAEYESRMPPEEYLTGAQPAVEEPAEEEEEHHRSTRRSAAAELYAPTVSLMSRRAGYPSRERITIW